MLSSCGSPQYRGHLSSQATLLADEESCPGIDLGEFGLRTTRSWRIMNRTVDYVDEAGLQDRVRPYLSRVAEGREYDAHLFIDRRGRRGIDSFIMFCGNSWSLPHVEDWCVQLGAAR